MDNEIFKNFAFYGGLLAAKMLAMGFLTAKQRLSQGVFANPEDTLKREHKVQYGNEQVERVRRAHLNDMENIYLFFVTAGFYVMTNPSVWTSLMCFRIFTAARYMHTFVYLCQIPQPSRSVAHLAALAVQIYMVFNVICHFM